MELNLNLKITGDKAKFKETEKKVITSKRCSIKKSEIFSPIPLVEFNPTKTLLNKVSTLVISTDDLPSKRKSSMKPQSALT